MLTFNPLVPSVAVWQRQRCPDEPQNEEACQDCLEDPKSSTSIGPSWSFGCGILHHSDQKNNLSGRMDHKSWPVCRLVPHFVCHLLPVQRYQQSASRFMRQLPDVRRSSRHWFVALLHLLLLLGRHGTHKQRLWLGDLVQ